MAYTQKVKFSETNRFGCKLNGEDDVYTRQEFREACEDTVFIDEDGFGYPVKDNMADPDIVVKPSKLNRIPDDATHIVWFNR